MQEYGLFVYFEMRWVARTAVAAASNGSYVLDNYVDDKLKGDFYLLIDMIEMLTKEAVLDIGCYLKNILLFLIVTVYYNKVV